MTVTEDALLAIRPLLDGRFGDWHGLPALTVEALVAALGPAEETREESLGVSWARQMRYADPPLDAWVRAGWVVQIDVAPAAGVLEVLGQPDEVLPAQHAEPGQYVHEYRYARRGLLVAVAEPLAGGLLRPVRVRGIRASDPASPIDPDVYVSMDDDDAW